jgi:phospholipase/carboxylesterase
VIHGLGDSPGPHWLDLVQLQRPARLIMPAAPTPYLDGFSWFPFRARGADPAELAHGISRAAAQLANALELLQRHRPTRGLPIVTGFSQGGMLSFALALRHPERLQLALPISGLLPEPLWPTGPAPRVPPIVALHGSADDLVPIAPTERLVAALEKHGYDVTLHRHAGVGHSISDAMRAQVAATLDAALSRTQQTP